MSTDIFLYQGELVPSDIILSDPTVQRTSGNMYFVALAASMSQFSGTVNKKTTRFLTASMSSFSTAVSFIKNRISLLAPPVIARGFGVSPTNPVKVAAVSPMIVVTQPLLLEVPIIEFVQPPPHSVIPIEPAEVPAGIQYAIAADMPRQFLVAPGNGRLSGRTGRVVAGGLITVPAATTNFSTRITLYQNYLAVDGTNVHAQKDPLSIMTFQPPAGTSANWSIFCKLTGNGRKNGFLKAESSSGIFYSNRNPRAEPILRLSIVIEFFGTNSGPDLPEVSLTQFGLTLS